MTIVQASGDLVPIGATLTKLMQGEEAITLHVSSGLLTS